MFLQKEKNKVYSTMYVYIFLLQMDYTILSAKL